MISLHFASLLLSMGDLGVQVLICQCPAMKTFDEKLQMSTVNVLKFGIQSTVFITTMFFVCLFVLLLYVPSQQLWSLRDGQFT